MGCCLEALQTKKKDEKTQKKEESVVISRRPSSQSQSVLKNEVEEKRRKEQSIELKDQGNQSFKKNDFLQAIRYYTQAINLYQDSVFYSNRAQCFRQLFNWTEVLKDSCEAIRLDQDNYKAFNLKGMAQVMISRDMDTNQEEWEVLNSQGIKSIQKALDMINSQKKHHDFQLISSIQSNISKATQILNLKKEEKRAVQKQKVKLLLEKFTQKNVPSNSSSEFSSQDIKLFINRKLTPKEEKPPDAFFCIFTLDLMVNPVITSSGLSYEKALLEDHIRVNGAVDPTTRVKLDPDKFIENINLKLAIQDYKRKIIDQDIANNYRQINF